MAWFEKEMDYARQSLEKVSEHAIGEASDKLNSTMREGISQVSAELRDIVTSASHDVDAKLDKISNELHSQRQFTKNDIRELVDYAADKVGATIDARVLVMKQEITTLVQEKVEYFKAEIDTFFVQRQQDIARERRRLVLNILIAVAASVMMAGVSLLYHRYTAGTMDLFGVFRVVFVSLTAGYIVYMVASMVRRYQQMTEHKKDVMFLAMKYWGFLRPENVFSHLLVLMVLLLVFSVAFFPEWIVYLTGSDTLSRWLDVLHGR